MKFFYLIKKTVYWLWTALELQIALMTASLPLLIAWGLPISMISIIGNIIFTPFLICYLFLSSLIFFCELVCLSNSLFIILLEKLQILWMSLILKAPKAVFLELPAHPVILIVIFCLGLILICWPITKQFTRIFCLLSFIILSCLFLKMLGSPRHAILHDFPDCKTLSFIKTPNSLICIDRGTYKRTGIDMWVDYKVLPILRKKFGTSKIDHIIILKPTPYSYQLTRELLKENKNSTITFPFINKAGKKPIASQVSLDLIKTWASEQNHKINSFTKGTMILILTPHCEIKIKSNGILQKNGRSLHQAIYIYYTCDKFTTQIAPILAKHEQVAK